MIMKKHIAIILDVIFIIIVLIFIVSIIFSARRRDETVATVENADRTRLVSFTQTDSQGNVLLEIEGHCSVTIRNNPDRAVLICEEGESHIVQFTRYNPIHIEVNE